MNLIREFQSGDYITKTMNTCCAHDMYDVNFALAIMEYMKMVLIVVALIYYLITEKSKPLY